jgi:hypothetical protein
MFISTVFDGEISLLVCVVCTWAPFRKAGGALGRIGRRESRITTCRR